MANIHLIGGEKGGVGKSLVSRLLAQYFIDHSIPFMGFDSDRSHGALLRFYVLHCVGLPLVAGFLMAIHFWRIRRDGGISGPL